MKREIPPVLWISIVVLGVVSVLQLFIALQRGPASLLVSVVLNMVLLAGLLHGCRWAYVLTLVLSAVGVAVGLGKGDNIAMGVLAGNALVVIPLVFSTGSSSPLRRSILPNRTWERNEWCIPDVSLLVTPRVDVAPRCVIGDDH